MLAVTKHLLQQTIFCCDRTFVATNICHDKHAFVVSKVLTRQAYFCCNKRCVLSQQTCVCHDKSKLVAAKLCLMWQKICLLQQKFCCDKHTFVAAKDMFCCDKHMLLRQTWVCDKHVVQSKWYLWQLPLRIQDDLTKTNFSFLCYHRVSTTCKSLAVHHQAIFQITASTFKLLLALKLTQSTQWVSMHPQFLHVINISVNIACLYIAGAPGHKPVFYWSLKTVRVLWQNDTSSSKDMGDCTLPM